MDAFKAGWNDLKNPLCPVPRNSAILVHSGAATDLGVFKTKRDADDADETQIEEDRREKDLF
jgi:hypothetical protein